MAPTSCCVFQGTPVGAAHGSGLHCTEDGRKPSPPQLLNQEVSLVFIERNMVLPKKNVVLPRKKVVLPRK